MPGRATVIPAVLALALLAAFPAPVARAGVAAVPTAAAVDPGPDAGRPFRVDLARPSDFVAQANLVQCVGASVQMMANIVRPGADRTARTQHRIQVYARAMSGPTPPGFVRKGASIRGWVAALASQGVGPYRLVGAASLDEAMHVAARAIRLYDRPVGLLVWGGRHAWVMSGFVATADPLGTDRFRVTGAYILDPLYPSDSRTWGASPQPGNAIPVAEVGRQFVPRRGLGVWRSLGPASLSDRWVLAVPMDAVGSGPGSRSTALPA